MNQIDPELLKILCCPETRQPVGEADAAVVADLNRRIAGGGVKNRGGHAVKEELDGALVRADRKLAYPVRQRIPIMLVEEGILLE